MHQIVEFTYLDSVILKMQNVENMSDTGWKKLCHSAWRKLNKYGIEQFTTMTTSRIAQLWQRPRKLGDFNEVGHFKAKLQVKGLRLAPISMGRYVGEGYATALPLEVSHRETL